MKEDFKKVILTLEDLVEHLSSKDKEEICLSDVEATIYQARAAYYRLTGESVEGEK